MFSNREIATIAWITIFVLWAVRKAEVRGSFAATFIAASRPKLIGFYSSLFIYISLFTCLLYSLKYWSFGETKDTVLWYLFVAIPLGSNAAIPEKRKKLWLNVIFDNLKFLAITEFLVGQYSYNIVIELLLIPIVSFLVIVTVLPSAPPALVKLSNSLLATIGFVVIGLTIGRMVQNRQDFLSIETPTDFLHPLVYSIAVLPYLFVLSVISDYDGLLLRIRFSKLNGKDKRVLKIRLLLFCGLNPRRLKIANNMHNYNLMSLKERSQINDVIESYKAVLQKTSQNEAVEKLTPDE